MDGRSCVSSQVTCKRCGKNAVKNFVTCEKCSSVFHQSCAKCWKGVKVINEGVIRCCEDTITDDVTDSFFDAIEGISVDNKVDICIFAYVIKQKDEYIRELQERIRLLNEHISVVQGFQANMSTEKREVKNSLSDKCSRKNVSNKNPAKGVEKTKTDNSGSILEQKDGVVDPDLKTDNKSVNTLRNNENRVSNKDMSVAMMQAQTQLVTNKLININNDINSNTKSTDGHEWKTIRNRKRRSSVLVGKNRDSAAVKGVPRWVDLHVYRLEPHTTPESVVEMLKPHIPEVKCEAITPKYPDLYASFKVSVREENFKTAMNADIWPFGACVSRFFYKRKPIQSQIT